MSSNTIGFKISFKLILAAMFYGCAFILFFILVSVNLDKIKEFNTTFKDLQVQANFYDNILSDIIVKMSIAIIIATFLYAIIIRSIRKRIQKVLDFSEQIAAGDLTVVNNDESKDEIGQISQALETVKINLRETLITIKEISSRIMNASSEFNTGSQIISSGASSQASSAEEISAAMEQIADIIKQSAENANETGIIAKNAFEGIQHGAGKVESALAVIEDIARKNSIIKEISYQTKILSINASVEAARAAEIGRGFAVVAEEVKRLAETTQSSATEIGIVSKKGVELTRESAGELRLLVVQFQKTAELVNLIAEASKEHNYTIEQINFSLQELNNITQQNASSAQELAASSDDLVKLTHSLEETISFFKLIDDQPEHNNSQYIAKNETEKFNPKSFIHKEDESFHFSGEKSFNGFDNDSYDKFQEPIISTGESEEYGENDLNETVAFDTGISNEITEVKNEKSKKKEGKVKINQKGVRINLADNDDFDNQFEKMK